MAIFVVTFEHPDETGWGEQVLPHIHYLQDLLARGVLLASGPFTEGAVKSAMLVIDAEDRAALDAIIAADPFAEHGLIHSMIVRPWDPIFGAFNARSSLPGKMQTRD